MSKTEAAGGFTLVEIMIVVAIIGFLAAIAIPNFKSSTERARISACVNNLRVIDAAQDQYALENSQAEIITPTSTDLSPYMRSGTLKTYCPLDPLKTYASSYTDSAISDWPACKKDPTNHTLP